MAKCPNDGTEVKTPTKTWTITGKPMGGKRVKLTLGIFHCPTCGKNFRAVISKEIISA
ncbi:MAG: chromatin protein Cren7 [Thermoprotei archaeon]